MITNPTATPAICLFCCAGSALPIVSIPTTDSASTNMINLKS